MMGKFIDETGKRFGRLLVVRRVENKRTSAQWYCQCDCGGSTKTSGHHLRSGHTQSCGCAFWENSANATKKHGATRTPLYNVWKEMRQRCKNENHARWENYGGRGIKVHPEWDASYEAFFRDVGSTYKLGLQIDRINNDGNYEPGNTRWVDRKTNVRNSRTIVINQEDVGLVKTLYALGCKPAEISRSMGISKHIVRGITYQTTWTDIPPLVAL
jgi:hypothetical protein